MHLQKTKNSSNMKRISKLSTAGLYISVNTKA